MSAEPKPSRGSRAALGAGIATAAALAGLAGAIAAGTFLARKAVTPARAPAADVSVERISREDGGDGALVWLRGPDADLPGPRYSFIFDGGGGHARVGEVVARRGALVARELVRVDRGRLREGSRGRVTGWWYTDPEETGFRSEEIVFPGELGEISAWLIRPARARKRRWAVHVHGRGALPEETLRGVAPLARAGITSLVLRYRNDPGAPAGGNGRYGVGIAESRDVDAAIAEALRRGAERVTLFGWSMGGTASLLAARGPHAAAVDGLILDSPALDWPAILRHQAAGMRSPRAIADIGMALLERGVVRGGEPGGIPFGRLTPESFARELQLPVLIHASEGDTYVPCGPAERLAELRPDLVQLRLQRVGEHVKLWNVDPAPWERATERFARSLPHPPWRG